MCSHGFHPLIRTTRKRLRTAAQGRAASDSEFWNVGIRAEAAHRYGEMAGDRRGRFVPLRHAGEASSHERAEAHMGRRQTRARESYGGPEAGLILSWNERRQMRDMDPQHSLLHVRRPFRRRNRNGDQAHRSCRGSAREKRTALRRWLSTCPC